MKCDIIIPVWNELEATRSCLESVIKNTGFSYRLIIIDNASQQETAQYLDGLKDKVRDFLLVRNNENLGFVEAINQGFKISGAEFVCLLNNDTIVTDGWLDEMVDVAINNVGIGIVNPSSNTLAQNIPKGETVDSYAKSIKVLKGQWGELGQCSGFCMLIKRDVIDKIGILDEAYEVGYFEEADYCRRAQKAGYMFARAKAAYVYHLDRLSFDKRKDKEELFFKNKKIFENRWGKSLRIACIISKPPKDRIDKDETEQIILSSARENHRVYVFIRKSIVSKLDIAEHSNILIFEFNNTFFPIVCFFKIITKKEKKRFNLILSDGLICFHILRLFSSLHKAKLMFNPHLEWAIESAQMQSFLK